MFAPSTLTRTIISKGSLSRARNGWPSVWGTSSLCPSPKRPLQRKIASNWICNCRAAAPVAGLSSRHAAAPALQFTPRSGEGAPFTLSNLLGAKIGQQLFREPHRTVFLLTSFDQRGKQSRQGQARAIQSMTKTVFAFRILEPQIHPARLKIREVRATRNFQIGVLSRRPNLDVVGLGRTKAEITGAEFNHAIMQPE